MERKENYAECEPNKSNKGKGLKETKGMDQGEFTAAVKKVKRSIEKNKMDSVDI